MTEPLSARASKPWPVSAVESFANFAVLGYLRHSPIRRGKHRLLKAASSFLVAEIGGVRLRVTCPEEHYLIDGYEQVEIDAFLDLVKPGMTVLDIGANIGIYSLLAARRVGTQGVVHAFEPNPEVAVKLRANVELNGFVNIVPNEVALCNQVGTMKFYLHAENVRSSLAGVSDLSIDVPTMTLDSYLERAAIKKVDVIKIDVEGAEVQTLLGARNLLTRSGAPAILFEVNPAALALMGASDVELIDLLKSYGYSWRAVAEHIGDTDSYVNGIATK